MQVTIDEGTLIFAVLIIALVRLVFDYLILRELRREHGAGRHQ